MDRALPDVRDGLKPVHRRILYAMRELRLDPDGRLQEMRQVVGDVMGNYHPHGDQASTTRWCAWRRSSPCATRWSTARATSATSTAITPRPCATPRPADAAAAALLDGLDEDTVDFRATYNGDEQEPVVLPASFPNLLANGSSGIAVGMATSIPPHNVEELCTAVLHLIKHPNAHIDKLVEMVPGPDFPTGGVLVEPREQILEAYKTGRGGFRLRAKWEKEDTGSGTYQIVVTEIPYQVQKAKLVERMAELINDKKLPLLGDVRDEWPRRAPGAGAQEPRRRSRAC